MTKNQSGIWENGNGPISRVTAPADTVSILYWNWESEIGSRNHWRRGWPVVYWGVPLHFGAHPTLRRTPLSPLPKFDCGVTVAYPPLAQPHVKFKSPNPRSYRLLHNVTKKSDRLEEKRFLFVSVIFSCCSHCSKEKRFFVLFCFLLLPWEDVTDGWIFGDV